MPFTTKRWAGLGLTAALLSTTALAGCGGEGGETGEAHDQAAAHGEAGEGTPMAHGEAGEGEGGEGEGGHGSMSNLSPAKRAAFMAGHVEAGLTLLQAGEADQATPHLGHPIMETHSDERAGLNDLGFEQDLFQVLLDASTNDTAADLETSQVEAARQNLLDVIEATGEAPKETIEYLLDVTVEEYAIGVKNGAISDPGEYADAYGFVRVAMRLADRLPTGDAQTTVKQELNALLDMWPEAGPVINDAPMAAGNISAQVSRVRLELSDIE